VVTDMDFEGFEDLYDVICKEIAEKLGNHNF